MIKFGISARAVSNALERRKDATAQAEAARLAFNAACDVCDVHGPLSRFMHAHDCAELMEARDAYADAEAARMDADAVATAMQTARRKQIENAIARALHDHADDLDGLPAHYKRTHNLIRQIVGAALEVDPDDVNVYKTYHYSMIVTCANGKVEFYVGNENIDAESVRNWTRPKDGIDDLTPAKVRRLAAQRARALKTLREAAKAYQETVRDTVHKFACIDDTDDLRRAANVNI